VAQNKTQKCTSFHFFVSRTNPAFYLILNTALRYWIIFPPLPPTVFRNMYKYLLSFPENVPRSILWWHRVVITGISLPSRSWSIYRLCEAILVFFWHVYVLGLGYFVWPWSPHMHRISPHRHRTFRDVTPRIVLQVWPIPTVMPLESKRRQNTINSTDGNVSCYCNSKLPKTYTWSGTFILKDGRYTFIFFLK
jgi:hypothetical protein